MFGLVLASRDFEFYWYTVLRNQYGRVSRGSVYGMIYCMWWWYSVHCFSSVNS